MTHLLATYMLAASDGADHFTWPDALVLVALFVVVGWVLVKLT